MTQAPNRPDRGQRNPTPSPIREGGKGDGIPPKVEINQVYRLNYEVYKLIEQKVGHIRGDTGIDNIAFQLGIQKVLQVLRNDIVIDPQ
jgi:hypothetical protein